MLDQLARNWWAVALRGGAACLFGVLALLWPSLTVIVLVYLFGAYALVDGAFALVAAIQRAERHRRWGATLDEGIVGVVAGILAFAWPGITAIALLYVIAAWALVTGVLEIMAAIRPRQILPGEWLLGLSGALSIIFALALFARPAAGAVAVVWIIGWYAIFFGVVLLVLAFRLRGRQARRGSGLPPFALG